MDCLARVPADRRALASDALRNPSQAPLTWSTRRTRSCGHSSHPDHATCNGDEGCEGRSGLVISGGDPTKMLDFADEALDEMPLFVEVSIIGNGVRPTGVGRDHSRHVELRDMRAKRVGVEGLVAQNVLRRQPCDQRLGHGRFVHLAAGVEQPQHISESINCDMDLRAQAPTRPPNRLFLNPPFPPAACWCARMIVPSMMTHSKSGSSASAAK